MILVKLVPVGFCVLCLLFHCLILAVFSMCFHLLRLFLRVNNGFFEELAQVKVNFNQLRLKLNKVE